MSKNCEIMTRMKRNYENRNKYYLTRRTPVILRIDGKAFHTYTRGLDKPFDEGLIADMEETAKFLCAEIQGAKCAYTQSDEINILVTDYDSLQTDAWFDYNLSKINSVAASLATAKFNELRRSRRVDHRNQELAFFDCRAFNVPKEEVPNYFYARQKDAVKNSISSLAQSLYSNKELHKKNQNEMQEMCFQKGHNWNDLPYQQKRGSFVEKITYVYGVGKVTHYKDMSIPFAQSTLPTIAHIGDVLLTNQGDVKLYSDYGTTGPEWADVQDPVVRTHWITVETPMSLNDSRIFADIKRSWI